MLLHKLNFLGRYAWILLTQKRLMLRKNFRRLPKWVTCQSQPHTYGWSFLDKTFRLTIREFVIL